MGSWPCPYCGGSEEGCEECGFTGKKHLAIVEGESGAVGFVHGSGPGLTDEQREAWRAIVDEAVALAPPEAPPHDVEAQP